jgi:hypothetical protein
MNNNKNPDDYTAIKEALYINGDSVLTRKTPVKLMIQIMQGKIDRFMAWQALRLVHEKQEKCYFPQYGILTVFSLANDMDEFKRLYDQGCQMLLNEGIISDENMQEDAETAKKLSKNLTTKKVVVKVKKNNAPNNRFN